MNLQNIRLILNEMKAEAILFKSEINRYWLTQYKSSFGYLFVSLNKVLFITDTRYYLAAVEHYKKIDPTIEVKTIDANTTLLSLFEKFKKQEKINKLLIEKIHNNLLSYEMISKVFDNVQSITTSKLREIKTNEEIEILQKAADIGVDVMHYIWSIIKPGMSENEIKKIIKIKFFEFGADELSFEPIVAAGVNGANPHHRGSDYIIQDGDMVTLDIGCMYQGYASDMTRSIIVGQKANNSELIDIYNVVKQSQQLGLDHASVNISGIDLDAVCRNYIDRTKYKGLFVHGTGHGVGLEVHELPNVNTVNKELFKVNNVITIEPGIYKPNVGGVRIEDTIVVQNNKPIVLQQKCTKELQFIVN